MVATLSTLSHTLLSTSYSFYANGLSGTPVYVVLALSRPINAFGWYDVPALGISTEVMSTGYWSIHYL